MPGRGRLAIAVGLGLCLAALAIPTLAGPATAAEWTETVTAGSFVPVDAEIGDGITIEGLPLDVPDLVVPGLGGLVIPMVTATIRASPAFVSYDSGGARTVPVSFAFDAVTSPAEFAGDPDVLNALQTSQTIAGATLQVTVAAAAVVDPPPVVVDPPPVVVDPPPVVVDPPVVDPPAEVPPVVVPPVAPPAVIQPGVPLISAAPVPMMVSAAPRPTSVAVRPPLRRAPVRLPTALTGTLPVAPTAAVPTPLVPTVEPVAVAPAPAADRRTQTVTRQSSSGLSSVFGVLGGFQAPSADVTATVPFGIDQVPVALGLPTLLALMSICVAGAGLVQSDSTRPRRSRPVWVRRPAVWTFQLPRIAARDWGWDQLGRRLRPAGRLRWYTGITSR